MLPPEIRLAADADRRSIERNVRAAAARFGHVTLGRPTAGDGVMTSSWALEGEGGGVEMTVRLDSADGAVAEVGLVPAPVEPPALRLAAEDVLTPITGVAPQKGHRQAGHDRGAQRHDPGKPDKPRQVIDSLLDEAK